MNPDETPVTPAPPMPPAPPVFAPAPAPAAPAPAPVPPQPAPAAPAFTPRPNIGSLMGSPRPAPSAPTPRPRRARAVVAALAIVLALAGGGYAWAYRSGASAVPRAARALVDATSFHSESFVGVDVKSSSPAFAVDASGLNLAASLEVSSDLDRSNPEKPKSRVVLKGDLDGLSVGAELRVTGDVIYGKVSQIPGAQFSGDPELQKMVNQWFFVSLDDLATVAGEPVSLAADAGAGAKLEAAIASLVASGSVSFGAPSVSLVDGELVRTYGVRVDVPALLDAALPGMRARATTTESLALLDSFAPAARAAARALSFEGATVRVAVLSGELRALEGQLVFDGAKVDPSVLADLGVTDADPSLLGFSARLTFRASYSGYGDPVSVEAPSGATSAAALLGSASATATVSQDAYAAFLATLPAEAAAALEAFERGAAASCGAGDCSGVCAAPEAERALALFGARAARGVCRASADGYALALPLPDGVIFCTDIGAYGAVDALPGGDSCGL